MSTILAIDLGKYNSILCSGAIAWVYSPWLCRGASRLRHSQVAYDQTTAPGRSDCRVRTRCCHAEAVPLLGGIWLRRRTGGLATGALRGSAAYYVTRREAPPS